MQPDLVFKIRLPEKHDTETPDTNTAAVNLEVRGTGTVSPAAPGTDTVTGRLADSARVGCSPRPRPGQLPVSRGPPESQYTFK
jgi:hypothetical protein